MLPPQQQQQLLPLLQLKLLLFDSPTLLVLALAWRYGHRHAGCG